MSAPTLPAEILDLILDLIQSKSSLPTPSSQQSLASLALTSKQFLSPARIRLYSHPFPKDPAFSWIKAAALADTLRKSNLGRLVDSLEGIVPYMFKLAKLDPTSTVSLAYEIQGCTKVFSWYLAIITACSNLVEVDIYFERPHHLKMIEKALEPSISTLRTANFIDVKEHRSTRNRLTNGAVQAAFDLPTFQNVEHLTMESTEMSPAARLNHPLKTLTVKQSLGGSRRVRGVELNNLSRFETLRLSHNFSGFSNTLKSVAPALRHLTISNDVSPTDCTPTFSSYHKPPNFHFHARYLAPLVNLTSLTLTHLKSDWMSLLMKVSLVSPRLEVIDLHGSHWVQKDDHLLSSVEPWGRYEPACRRKQLQATLARLMYLKKLNLGVLPATNQQVHDPVKIGLEERGVEVEWKCCRALLYCPVCQTLHG